MKNEDGTVRRHPDVCPCRLVATATVTHIVVISVGQLRQRTRRRFNWRLPVSEKAAGGRDEKQSDLLFTSYLSLLLLLPFICLHPSYIRLLLPCFPPIAACLSRVRQPLLVFLPRTYTPSPAATSTGWPMGFRGGSSYGNITGKQRWR